MKFWKARLFGLGRNLRYKTAVLFLFFLGTASPSEAALPFCPTNADTTISNPCKLRPGSRVYNSLTIRADVFLETSSNLSVHELNVTQTLDIQSSAVLSVGPNKNPAASSNPGAGVQVGGAGSGGSHGGRGGATAGSRALLSNQSVPYGNTFDAKNPGSSGGGQGGGLGGGAIIIHARKVVINGKVQANGQRAQQNGGGGSGGSLAIHCFEIDGSGEIQAVGGLGGGSTGGGGGGGRISLHYQQGSFPGRTRAYGGKSGRILVTSN